MSKPLGNKPGEPPFQLKVDPDTKLVFKYKVNEPCTIELKITNTTKDRQTFKVKCTDNDIFRVRPPLSFVKPDETAVVKIVLTAKTPPENNRHFFAVYHMKCTDDTGKTARQVWTPDSKPEGVARIIAVFEPADGEKKEEKSGDKKEEEKKDEKKDEKKEEKKDEKKDEKKEEKKEEKKD